MMNKLLSSDDIRPKINRNIDDLNLKNDYLRLERVLEETIGNLKDSEETKALLLRRNNQLTEDNRTLYERLLNAEKGRILAEKDAFEIEKKINEIKFNETMEEGIQVSDKILALDSSTSTFSMKSQPEDLCENCGSVKVITCSPADAIILSRSDVKKLDADMSMLKEVLLRKELLYNEAIENNATLVATMEDLSKQVESLKSQQSWKNTVIAQKDKELQTLKMEGEIDRNKIKRIHTHGKFL
uniref:Uncharacterized protein n=1 Tax=Triatoma infestans TaxID=30076 RepID=A0A161MN04_TRIIF